jgi:hypothetical protein
MSRTPSAVVVEKSRAEQAHEMAVKADPARRALFDRWLNETRDFVRGAKQPDAREMWRRQRILFECIADRSSWPRSFT